MGYIHQNSCLIPKVTELWHFITLCKEKIEKKIKASFQEEFTNGFAPIKTLTISSSSNTLNILYVMVLLISYILCKSRDQT